MVNDQPANLESERTALATIIQDRSPNAWQTLIDIIRTPLAFFNRDHQIIAISLQHLSADGNSLSATSVSEWLLAHSFGEVIDIIRTLNGETGRKPHQQVDAPKYEDSALAAIGLSSLGELAGLFAPTAALSKTAKTIAAHHRQRKALAVATSLVDALREPSGVRKIDDLIDATMEKLISAVTPDRGVSSLTDGIDRKLTMHDDARDNPGVRRGALFGLPCLDQAVPLSPGTLTTIAARTGAGKTSLLLHILEATARHYGPGSVAFVSREMGAPEIASVILARHLRIPRGAVDRGGMTYGQREQADVIRREADKWNIWINDGMECTSQDACAWAQAHHRATGGRLALLAIDHLGILTGDHPKQTEYERTSKATGKFKALARVLQIPVVLLCQMSRDDKRATRGKDGNLLPDLEPQLLDLRGSGTIEQDSDQVLFLYRPTHEKLPNGVEQVTAKAAKVRAGPRSKVTLEWRPTQGQRFASLAGEQEQLDHGQDDGPTRAERIAAPPSDFEMGGMA